MTSLEYTPRTLTAADGTPYPRPLVKTVGGKSWLRPALPRLVPMGVIQRYHEPCIGGGPIFGALSVTGYLDQATAIIGDRDLGLARLWATVRDHPRALADRLDTYRNEIQILGSSLYGYEKDIFNHDPDDPDPHRILWLRYATYTGLWRVSREGKLNVSPRPLHELRKLPLPSRAELLAWSAILRKHDTSVLHHDTTWYDSDDTIVVGEGDLLFVDPPYFSTFTGYTAHGFDLEDQRRLISLCARWTGEGARVIFTNADVPAVRSLLTELWPAGHVEVHMVPRTVNSKRHARGAVPELVVTSHPPVFVDPSLPSPAGARVTDLSSLPTYLRSQP